MKYVLNFQDIKFTSPVFLWTSLVLVFMMLIFIFIRSVVHRGEGIKFVEVDFSLKPGFSRASIGRYIKVAFISIAIVLVGIILSGPYTENFEGAITVKSSQKLRTSVALIDVSASMRSKLEPKPESDLRFNVARDKFVNFLQQADSMRVGVIFYSEKSMPFRWFTRDIDALSEDISDLEISLVKENDMYDDLGLAQIRIISGSTNTPEALRFAGYMLNSLEMSDEEFRSSVSIILFSDLQDNLSEVMQNIRGFTAKGVRVYVIAIAQDKQVKAFERSIAGNELVKIFKAQNEQDMEKAFNEIGELESSTVAVEEVIQTKKSLTLEFAQLLFLVLLILVFFSEVVFHAVRGSKRPATND